MERIISKLIIAPLLVAFIVACDRSPSGPTPEPGVYVSGVVRDEDGIPVPLITVAWEAWPAPDSVEQGSVGDFSVSWFTRTDSMGRFTAHAGYYSIAQLDSVEVGVAPDGCWGLAPLMVRERDVAVSPGIDTVLNRELTLIRTGARARLSLGQSCAVIVTPPPLQEEDRFGLWIDDISDSIRGRWRINYQGTRGDDYGYFSGWREGNSVILGLRHETPWDAGLAGGPCEGYTLELPLEEGDTFGTGTYRSDGCPFTPAGLRFIEGGPLSWPSPHRASRSTE